MYNLVEPPDVGAAAFEPDAMPPHILQPVLHAAAAAAAMPRSSPKAPPALASLHPVSFVLKQDMNPSSKAECGAVHVEHATAASGRYRRTLRGQAIPEGPPPESEWKLPAEIVQRLPDNWENAIQSIENSGCEFSYYCRRYQHDNVTPYPTMSGLLASWEILEKNLVDLKEAVDHLSDKQRVKAGGPSGLAEVYEAIEYRQFYVGEYRQAMSKLGEGIPIIPLEDPMT